MKNVRCILDKVIQNNYNKKVIVINKLLILNSEEYKTILDTLYKYTLSDKVIINYTEFKYTTKTGNERAKIKFFITLNGRIINISHIVFLIYKKFIPCIKLNIKHNYIIGDSITALELYARIANHIVYLRKQHKNYNSDIALYKIEKY